MGKKIIKIVSIFLLTIVVLGLLSFFIYPQIEFTSDGKMYACRFSDDFSEFEENASYNELYFYYEPKDISLKNFEVKNFLFFYVLSFDYVEGDFRETQFLLEEAYIKNFLKNAVIEENEANIDIAALIEGKTAVVSGKKYSGNEYDKGIFYTLDGKYQEMYVFESEGYTVIQVGSPDELPKFIAYK